MFGAQGRKPARLENNSIRVGMQRRLTLICVRNQSVD